METPYLNRFKQNSLPKSNDKKSYIIAFVFGTILIATLFTQTAISDYMEKGDAIEAANARLQTATAEKDKLQLVEKSIKEPVIADNLKRYAGSFREDDIFENIFSNTSGVSIQNINIDKGQKTSNGLSLANITMTLTTTSKEQLIAFLNYLTDAKGTKRYVIKSLSYPFDPANSGGLVSLSLGMYYFENSK